MEDVLYCIQMPGRIDMYRHTDAIRTYVFMKKGYRPCLPGKRQTHSMEELSKTYGLWLPQTMRHGFKKVCRLLSKILMPDVPKDHIINLDYPLLAGDPELCGTDQIQIICIKLLYGKEVLVHFGQGGGIRSPFRALPGIRRALSGQYLPSGLSRARNA